jgi:hypothetical protein
MQSLCGHCPDTHSGYITIVGRISQLPVVASNTFLSIGRKLKWVVYRSDALVFHFCNENRRPMESLCAFRRVLVASLRLNLAQPRF